MKSFNQVLCPELTPYFMAFDFCDTMITSDTL